MATGQQRLRTGALGLVLIALGAAGCTRAYHRNRADQETQGILAEKEADGRLILHGLSIERPPQSRLHDSFNTNCPPMPPDDPAAHDYMHAPNGLRGYKHWHDDGDAPSVESPDWKQYLRFSDDNQLVISPDSAVELGIVHSRAYQTELEDLYLSALALTVNRFEFQLHWFARNTTTYQHSGSSSRPNESNTLTTDSNVGFSRELATGGQLLVDFANSFVWEFTGANTTTASSHIMIDFVQPLLRRAGRDVRLEELTQAERDVLYAVRDFARFRKQFYLNTAAGSTAAGSDGFLSLLLQVQAIRNLEANLVALQRDLELHEALAKAGIVSRLQVDQVFQTYQAGKVALIRAETELETDLDAYKLRLGLPPETAVRLDDSLLEPFELQDPGLSDLEREVGEFLTAYRELEEPPSADEVDRGFAKLWEYIDQTLVFMQHVGLEIDRWRDLPIAKPDPRDPERGDREQQNREQLTERLTELGEGLEKLARAADEARATLEEEPIRQGWNALLKLTRRLNSQIGELSVIQTQVRAYLVRLDPIPHEGEDAVELGLRNRLDLMNQRARVVDAWRRTRVAADRLETDLDVFFRGNIGTDPDRDNPLNFSAQGSTYAVGFRIDGPLNRAVERSLYRGSLINYQRARRAYMALEDGVKQAVRRDVRRLEADRINFEISRERLITAARQVEEARVQLEAPGRVGDSSNTQDVLNALNSLLQAKNELVATWVAYETGRLQLLVDTEAMELDSTGLYSYERQHPRNRSASGEPLPSPTLARGKAGDPAAPPAR